jgi:hypothetical protein
MDGVKICGLAVWMASRRLFDAPDPGLHCSHAIERSRAVGDVALVLLTVGLFAVLAMVVRAVEKL